MGHIKETLFVRPFSSPTWLQEAHCPHTLIHAETEEAMPAWGPVRGPGVTSRKKTCPNSSLASPLCVDYMAALGIKEVPCVGESPKGLRDNVKM